MKQLFLLGCSILFFTACNSSAPQEKASFSSQGSAAPTAAGEVNNAAVRSADGNSADASISQPTKLVMHPVNDIRRGMVAYHIPLPSDWRIDDKATGGQPFITAPGEVKVFNYGLRSFMYSQDPMTQETYRMSGQNMRNPIGVERAVQEDIFPIAQKEGLTLVNKYHVPELIAYDRAYSGMLFKSVPSQDFFDVWVTEWKDAKGKPSMMIVHYTESASYGNVYWYYSITAMEASTQAFEQAKKDLINGLANIQNNPALIQAYNQEEAQKKQSDVEPHNQRMKSNQASFEQTQRAMKSSNDAINNSIMSTWESRNASSDRMQRNTVNSINEENTDYRPSQWPELSVRGRI